MPLNQELDKTKTRKYLQFLSQYAGDIRNKVDSYDPSLNTLLNEFSVFQDRVKKSTCIGKEFKDAVESITLNIKTSPHTTFVRRLSRVFYDRSGVDWAYFRLKDNLEILDEFIERIEGLLYRYDSFTFKE